MPAVLRQFLLDQRFTAKVIVAALLAMMVGQLLQFTYHETMWSVITVFVATDARMESTLTLSFNRVIGTALGVSVAAFLLWCFNPHSLAGMCVCLVVLSIVASQVQLFGKGVRVAGVAGAIVLFMGAMQENYLALARDRFIDISIGVLCALVASILVFPRRNRKDVSKNTVKALRLMQSSYAKLTVLEGGREEIASELEAMKPLLEQNRTLLQEIKLAHGRHMTEVTLLMYFADVLEEVYLHLRAMHSPLAQEAHQKIYLALREELIFSQSVLSKLIDQLISIIEFRGYDKATLSALKLEVKTAMLKLDKRFIAGRVSREFKDYDEAEVLGAYTFLYQVKSVLKSFRIAAAHVAKLAEIYYR